LTNGPDRRDLGRRETVRYGLHGRICQERNQNTCGAERERSGADSGLLAAVQDVDSRVSAGELVGDVAGPVRAAVVDDK